MNKISQVLDDFYHSTGIDIKFWDFSNTSTSIIKTSNLFSPKMLKRDVKGTRELTTLTYRGYIHFIVLPFDQGSNIQGHFVAGPFQSHSPQYKDDIAYKPFYCLTHFERLLKTITRKQLSAPMRFDPSILKGIEYIHTHYRNEIALDQICNHLGLNKCYFCSLFKRSTELTFSQFLNRVRVDASKQYLLHSSDSVLEVALANGFNNHNYFSSTFKKIVGISPIDFRKKHSVETTRTLA